MPAPHEFPDEPPVNAYMRKDARGIWYAVIREAPGFPVAYRCVPQDDDLIQEFTDYKEAKAWIECAMLMGI